MSSKTETKSTVDGNQLAETESLSTSLSQPNCRNNDVSFKLNATVVFTPGDKIRDNKITACFKLCVMHKFLRVSWNTPDRNRAIRTYVSI